MTSWLSSLVGAVGGGVSSAMNFAYSKSLMNHQYKIQKTSAQEMPSLQREGLTRAGYNPMLALGNIGSGGSAGIASFSGTPDIGDNITNATQVQSQKKLNEASVQQVNADTYGKAIDNYWKPSMLEAQVNATNAQTQLTIAQKVGQLLNNEYLPKYQREQLSLMRSEAFRNIMSGQSDVTNAHTNRMNVEGSLAIMAGQLGVSRGQLINMTNKTNAEIELMAKQGKLTDEQAKNFINMRRNRNYQAILNTINTAGNIYGVATGNPPSMGYQTSNIGF